MTDRCPEPDPMRWASSMTAKSYCPQEIVVAMADLRLRSTAPDRRDQAVRQIHLAHEAHLLAVALSPSAALAGGTLLDVSSCYLLARKAISSVWSLRTYYTFVTPDHRHLRWLQASGHPRDLTIGHLYRLKAKALRTDHDVGLPFVWLGRPSLIEPSL